jgi:ELWxxDGT repeat protein
MFHASKSECNIEQDDFAAESHYRINGMAVANKVLYFILSFTSNQLWKSNATTEGTIKVADIRPSGGLYSAGGSIFFVAFTLCARDEVIYASISSLALPRIKKACLISRL